MLRLTQTTTSSLTTTTRIVTVFLRLIWDRWPFLGIRHLLFMAQMELTMWVLWGQSLNAH